MRTESRARRYSSGRTITSRRGRCGETSHTTARTTRISASRTSTAARSPQRSSRISIRRSSCSRPRRGTGRRDARHQWTAKAYKGRVQIYDHQYAAAKATLQDVKANGPYSLETSFDQGLERVSGEHQRTGDDLRLSGLGERRRAERGQRQLWRAAEFPARAEPVRLLRLQPAVAEPGQLLPGRRGRATARVVVAGYLERDRTPISRRET